jgi:hypothetical protein
MKLPASTVTDHPKLFKPALPLIVVDGRRSLRSLTSTVLDVLASSSPPIYQRAGRLVRIRPIAAGGAAIEPVDERSLRSLLERVAQFAKLGRNGLVLIPPPMVCVQDILGLPEWPGIPPLAGIATAPLVRSNGEVVTHSGYDPESETVLVLPPEIEGLDIPEVPTERDLAAARQVLDEAFQDFAFKDDASRAAGYAAMLTAVLRPSIRGRTPLFVVDSPVMGSGKSALVGLCVAVATGGCVGVMPEPENEAEWRKSYTAKLHEGHTILWLDEVHRRLESPALAQAVTADFWTSRLLGTNHAPTYPNRTVIFCCGNNVVIGRDIGRRAGWCRLDTRLSEPYLRTFTRPDLNAWALQSRGRLVWGIFVGVRAWWATGCPDPHIPLLAGFSQWRQIVGGVLEVLGIHGLLSNAAVMREAVDEEASEIHRFLRAWRSRYGDEPVRAAQVARDVLADDELRDSLPSSLIQHMDERGGKLTRRLGNLLRRIADRRFGTNGIRVERAGDDGHVGVGLWRVVVDNTSSPAQAGFAPQELVLSRAANGGNEMCVGCGAPLPPGRTYRCTACAGDG